MRVGVGLRLDMGLADFFQWKVESGKWKVDFTKAGFPDRRSENDGKFVVQTWKKGVKANTSILALLIQTWKKGVKNA